MLGIYLNIYSVILILVTLSNLIAKLLIRFKGESELIKRSQNQVKAIKPSNLPGSLFKVIVFTIYAGIGVWQFHFGDIEIVKWMAYALFVAYVIRFISLMLASYIPNIKELIGFSTEAILEFAWELLLNAVITASLIVALAFYNN